MKIAEEELIWQLNSIVNVSLPARIVVEEAWENREKFHPSGQLIYFKSGGVPWKEHLFDIEEE